MTVQIWSADGETFYGRLTYYSEITTELVLSEAGEFSASAPYGAWRDLMELIPSSNHVRLYAADGTELMRGKWLTRDDDPGLPGSMRMSGLDLLAELRVPCLPPDFYISNYDVVSAITWLLDDSGTGWAIGDTSNAVAGYVSVNLGGKSILEAILELAETTGNYVRHDGLTRSLDVFGSAFDLTAYLYGVCPDDEAMPVNAGRVVPPVSLTMDAGDIVGIVYPQGGSVIDKSGNESKLYPDGTEELPSGFSFSLLRGQWAIVNDAVSAGLVRIAEFDMIEPLSNRQMTASGSIESTGNGHITSESLRRPNDGFWTGGIITVGAVGYPITNHSGSTISGAWGTLAVGGGFVVTQSFEYSASAEADARQSLVDAACGLLRARAAASQQLSIAVEGLVTRVKPGDTIELAWVATVETEDIITDELERFILTEFNGELIVASVTTGVAENTITTLGLVKSLELLPTQTGVREMRYLAMPAQGRVDQRSIIGGIGSDEPLLTWPGMTWIDTSE